MTVTDKRTAIGPRGLTHLQRAASGASSSGLPQDLLREQSKRMEVLYAIGVILWLVNLVLDISLAPQGDRGPYRLVVEGSAALLAAATTLFTRFGRLSDRTKVDLGVSLMVVHAFALAILNSWVEQPTTMRPVSGVTVLVLFFGVMAPASPGKLLTAGLVSASMDPVGVWIAHLRGLPVPGPLTTLVMFYSNYACAVLAVVPSRILYRLGREIREARALGSYHLIERLGRGGMGEVWVARHELLARCAAIKLIRPDMLAGSTRGEAALTLSRFEREAQATAALTSPHTIRLFDFGLTDEATFYYVMELLDGRDLESLVREFGPLPPARALHLIRQVCCSLAEAHARGLIHRDIKPANIYTCRMGLEYDFVKVLDFGLVKHECQADAPTALTGGALTMGTPGYVAPEVILGERDVDRRVDVYGIGCVAYFLVTGERVFDAASPMKLLMHHVQTDPCPPSDRAGQDIPRDFDDLVMACLNKDPGRRPRSAEDVFHMARSCRTADVWDQEAAKRWWNMHLPQLTMPVGNACSVSGIRLAVHVDETETTS